MQKQPSNAPQKNTPKSSSNPKETRPTEPFRLCLAPMMDWSDRHCRFFWRLLTKQTLLYSEMVTTGALLYGDQERFLRFNPEEHPVALQLGGSDPKALGQCATLAEKWGYDEVNLNCGCPSDRVQEGRIGAVLMSEPKLVAQCISAMQDACSSIPVTIKHRIGIDNMDEYGGLRDFIGTVAQTGCKRFIVHARKAWLKGLSPKENREIPPLNYKHVIQLKQDFPELEIIINGGITTLDQAKSLLNDVDGVMIGREAYQNPYMLSEADNIIFESGTEVKSREWVIQAFSEYCTQQIANGNKLHHMSRHILGLYSGQYGARQFRRHITEKANQPSATAAILSEAVTFTQRIDTKH